MTNYLPQLLWIALTVACLIIILAGLAKILRISTLERKKQNHILFGAILFFTVWCGLLLLLAYNGFFTDFSHLPPRPLLAIIIPLPLVIVFSVSKTGKTLLNLVPAHWLVYIQAFRIAVEILLWLAFTRNLLPKQMTFEGGNFDIATGILAIAAGYFIMKNKLNHRTLLIAFNSIGVILLLNILIIALLSMPTPIRYFMNEPSNTIVGQFPFILLPGVLVPIAYSFHILSFRKLQLERGRVNK